MSVRMLPESELPPGPRRDLVIALHRLYNAAGRPATRKISEWIRKNNELTGTLSHDAVSSTLRGLTVPRWESLESLVHVLAAAQVVGATDVQSAKEQIYRLWLLANDDSLPLLPVPVEPSRNTQEPGPTEDTTAAQSADDAADDDLLAARRWYEQSAIGGDVDAMLKLATLLSHRVVPPDLVGARECYEKAAAASSLEAMVKLGDLLFNEDLLFNGKESADRDGAAVWWEKAAEAGDPAAMVRLGTLASTAEPPDLETAQEWWEKAALAGESAAMNKLGVLHHNQEPPDLAGAKWWYQKAAFAGSAEGMLNLGRLMNLLDPPGEPSALSKFRNEMVGRSERPRPQSEWWDWIERAAKAGEPEAMTEFGRLLCSLRPAQVSTATLWFQKAAETGHAAAMIELGKLFQAQHDFTEAKRWYDEAVGVGHAPALERLADLLAGHQTLPGAREGLERAAEAGYSRAMGALAEHLWFHSPIDRDAAHQWHKRYRATLTDDFDRLLSRIRWWLHRH